MKNELEIKDCGMLNYILNYAVEAYESEGEDSIDEILNIFQLSRVTMIMKTNRLQSLYLCELLQSYSIQSQRYNRYDGDLDTDCIFNNLNYFTEGERNAISDIIKKCSEIYLKMTEIKEESKHKSKYSIEDFKYGIPVEDARFILPTAFTCNKEVTFEGISLLSLLKLFKYEYGIFPDMYEMLVNEIIRYISTSPEGKLSEEGEYVIKKLIGLLIEYIPLITRVVDSRFFNIFGDREKLENVNLIKDEINTENTMHKTGAAALMCTNTGDMRDVYNMKTDEQFKHVSERVAGETGHTSTLEHASYSFLIKASTPCYNQYVRHRHQQCLREDFNLDMLPYFIVPKTINNSVFTEEYLGVYIELTKLINNLTENTELISSTSESAEIKKKYRIDAIKQLYPMGLEIRFICTTNLTNELYNKFPKRLCNKAQWEMRNITREVYKIIENDIDKDNKLLDKAKPGCCTIKGCPEGKGRCKDNSEVLKIFKNK